MLFPRSVAVVVAAVLLSACSDRAASPASTPNVLFDHGDLLFDLEADPGEHNDLAAAMPDKVAELKRGLAELAAGISAPAASRADGTGR